MDLYHALNRGTEKRNIFLDTQDYARFVHNLYAFNDTERVLNSRRSFSSAKMNDLGDHSFSKRNGERLVDVHVWCLMRNHFHLLLSPRVEGGVSKFLMKVNVGYAKYFNEKYERDGTLFQGKTKRVLIERDAHFMHILNYIHLNPLDYLKETADWRERKIKSMQDALAYLDRYRWSSYLDYCGTHNFPPIITTELFGDKEYRVKLSKYLKTIEIEDSAGLTLE